jgi:hypothetical protein
MNPTPRLNRLLARRYQKSTLYTAKCVDSYRYKRDTWLQDWEGELKYFRIIIKIALEQRHEYRE